MWRDRDRYAGAAIDSSGELPDGTPIKGPDDLRKALLRRPEQFVQTFTEGLLTYATGRKLDYYDMPTVRRIVRGAAASDYRFSALVQAVVRSEQFRMRRVPQPAPSTATAEAAPVTSQSVGVGAERSSADLHDDGDTTMYRHQEARFTSHGVEGRRAPRIALPLLDAMNPAATAWAQTAAGRRRSGSPSSASRTARSWTAGRRRRPARDFEMSPILEPLEPFREHLTIVSGLRNKPGETPEPHGYIEMTWLTLREAVGPRRGRSRRRRQRRPVGGAAHRSGHAAAVARADDRAGRRARRLAHADAVAAAGRQPARGVPEAVRPGRHRQGARGDSARDRQHPRSREGDRPRGCRPASACSDRVVVSDYLDSVREIERRVQMASQGRTRRALEIPDAPVGTPNDITEHFKLMFDLMALAFQADITRVITFSMDREASMRTYTNLGIAEGVPSAVASREQPAEAGQAGADPDATTPRCSRSSSSGWRRRRKADGTRARSLDDPVRQQHEQQRPAQQRSAAGGDPRPRATAGSKAAST